MDFNINNMKKIITLVLLMCTITLVNSQNNLVFNKVTTQNLSPGILTTVPEGKVWKITAAGYSFKIDGGAPIDLARMPFWINEGSTIAPVSTEANFNSVSILEFNVVPTSSSVTSNSGFTGVSSHIDTYYFNEEFFISPIDGGRLIDLNSITVPEGQMWKVIYAFRTRIDIGNDSDNPSEMSEDAVLIDDMLFKDERRNEFWLESGEHSVKFKSTASNEKNKIVIRALIYDIN